MKKAERVVKVEDQIYCIIFDLICKKYRSENILRYVQLVDKRLIKTIKAKLKALEKHEKLTI